MVRRTPRGLGTGFGSMGHRRSPAAGWQTLRIAGEPPSPPPNAHPHPLQMAAAAPEATQMGNNDMDDPKQTMDDVSAAAFLGLVFYMSL